MKFRRPRSLNELILVGFALVALPLLVAVLWALFNLDRLAEQSEQLVITGVSAAEKNQLLTGQIGSLERVSRQYVVLRNADSLALLRPDFMTIEDTLKRMKPLAEQANALALVESIQGGGLFHRGDCDLVEVVNWKGTGKAMGWDRDRLSKS